MKKTKDTLRDKALNFISHLGDFTNDAVKTGYREILKINRTIELADRTCKLDDKTIRAFEKEDLMDIDMFEVTLSNKEYNDKYGD